jgi:hypothetical protein
VNYYLLFWVRLLGDDFASSGEVITSYNEEFASSGEALSSSNEYFASSGEALTTGICFFR